MASRRNFLKGFNLVSSELILKSSPAGKMFATLHKTAHFLRLVLLGLYTILSLTSVDLVHFKASTVHVHHFNFLLPNLFLLYPLPNKQTLTLESLVYYSLFALVTFLQTLFFPSCRASFSIYCFSNKYKENIVSCQREISGLLSE